MCRHFHTDQAPQQASHQSTSTQNTEDFLLKMENDKNNQEDGGDIRADFGLNIGITYRKSLNIQRYNVIILTILFLVALGLTMYSFSQDNVGWKYVGTHFFIPWIIVIVIQLLCTLYSILAWTRTSLR